MPRSNAGRLSALAALALLTCTRTETPSSAAPPADPQPSVDQTGDARAEADASPPIAESSVGLPGLVQSTPDAPLRPLPTGVDEAVLACERDWISAGAPASFRELTARCIATYLSLAYYGRKPSLEDMGYDPEYGGAIELRYTATQLRFMATLVDAGCPSHGRYDTLSCDRAKEFFDGMAERKTSLFENVNVDWITPALARILAEERLDDADLWLHHEVLSFSLLNLWKLEAAVYARHGQVFVDEDLSAFFYTARDEMWDDEGLPPLQAQDNSVVELTAIDRHNLERLHMARARLLEQVIGDSQCYVFERVLFDCTTEAKSRVSLCGGPGSDGAPLEWAWLRIVGEGGHDGLPQGLRVPIAELISLERDGDRLRAVFYDPSDGYGIERGAGHVVEIDGDRSPCRGPVIDQLDQLVGVCGRPEP